MLSTKPKTNLHPLILEQDAVSESQKACRVAVGDSLRSADLQAQLAIDEGVNYFTAKSNHDRANALFLARLTELLAEKRAA